MVPPFVKELHRRRKTIDVRKEVMGVRLPPEDEHELRYREGEKNKMVVRVPNPYTQAIRRQAFLRMTILRQLFR